MNKIKELVIITILFSVIVYSSYYIGVITKSTTISGGKNIYCNLITNNTTTLELTNIYTTTGLSSTNPVNVKVNSTIPVLLIIKPHNQDMVFGLTYTMMSKKLIVPVPSGEHVISFYVGVNGAVDKNSEITIECMKNNKIYDSKNMTLIFRT